MTKQASFQHLPHFTSGPRRWLQICVWAMACWVNLPVQAQHFQSADVWGQGFPTVKAVESMSADLGVLTQGRLSISVVGNGALGNEKETIAMLREGALAMTRVNTALLADMCPAMAVLSLPFQFESGKHLWAVLDGSIGQEILRSCEPQGLVGLTYYESGARSIFSTQRPIHSLSDMQGLRVRVQQAGLLTAMLDATGALAVPMPFDDVYAGLQQGKVDAAENNLVAYEERRFFEVAKLVSFSEHSMSPEILLFSRKVWDTLSAQDQAAVRAAAKRSTPVNRKLFAERERLALQNLGKSGVRFTRVNKASFRAAMRPIYDRFASQAIQRDLLRRIQESKP